MGKVTEDKNLLLRSQGEKIDFWLIGTSTILVLFGLLAIYDASVVSAFRDFGDKFYYFKNQLVWASFGFIALLFFSFFDYHKLLKYSPFFLISSIVLLIIVLVPSGLLPFVGSEKIYGARRWINIGSFTFQPSEITKLALIFYETAIISKLENYKIKLTDAFTVFFLPAILATILVIIQPDFGTALIFIAITLVVYFIGNGPIWHFLFAVPAVIISAIIVIFAQPYRLARIKTFLDPNFDPQGASYQINQILAAIASGGLLGVGIGASRSKFAFIPEVHSDAIFAIIVEELGFVGAIFLISLFIFLIMRAMTIAKHAVDFQGRILGMGIVALFSIQSLFNFAAIVALVPLTGIPLPFISYGGSSLFVSMASIGILLNIRKQS